MKTVITSQQMKDLDFKAINEFGIPSAVLMENAGKGCADMLLRLFPNFLKQSTVVMCGPGNNGGDGYVIARWLAAYDIPVYVIKVGEGKSSPETLLNMELCQKMEIEFIEITDNDYEECLDSILAQAGVIIDAIYGIGFKGKLQGQAADLIEKVNTIPAFKVAIDIPSGLNADTGSMELAFRADVTLTMESLKFGHLLGQGRRYSGITEVIPIGIPDTSWENEPAAWVLDEETACLPFRSRYTHKGDYGRIAVFAGSPGFTGAAFMASTAALKAGAGLVTIFTHPDFMSCYNSKPFEVMVKTTPLDKSGKLDEIALDTALEKFDTILFGPGCAVSEYTLQILTYIINKWNKPAVIDADGLNTLTQHPQLIKTLSGKPFILTPHWGEFCRLADIDMQALKNDCLTQLKSFVETNNLKVLLKSYTSIYYDTETMYFNINGNEGLATGGSGDVLSGLITGFLAQNMDFAEAAGSAAYYLGYTADLLIKKQETFSITPTDILDNIFKRDLYDDEE